MYINIPNYNIEQQHLDFWIQRDSPVLMAVEPERYMNLPTKILFLESEITHKQKTTNLFFKTCSIDLHQIFILN